MNLDLAAIGNCRIAALVDRSARIVWSCLPRLDGDPVFCSLLEPKAHPGSGVFGVSLENQHRTTQQYRGNTAVLVTELEDTDGGRVRVTDFIPRFIQFDRVFRPVMMVRRIEPLAGRPRVRVTLRPLFDHGSVKPQMTLGSNHIRYVGATDSIRLTTDAPLSYVAEEIPFIIHGPLHFILGADESLMAPVAATATNFLERTLDYWQSWARSLSIPFEWQKAVMRAAVTLKLCSFEETGGIVAALTTSIPESADSGRTWDYRCCWLRDSYFTVQALNQLGATRTMEDFIRYIANVLAQNPQGRLDPVYPIVHGHSLAEKTVDALAGYRGMGPVRVGNAAAHQVQNDSYGSAVLATVQAFFDRRLPAMGDLSLFHALERLGEQAKVAAFEPDASLWEYRNRARVHTVSAVMCWAACHRLSLIANQLRRPDRAAYWSEVARGLKQAILERAWSSRRNSFVDAFDGSDVDAALLLLHEVGFVAADDPRYLGTIAAVERELKRGNHVFRYVAADDFGRPENAFTICTFWYINALATIGRRDEAREMFQHLLKCRNHVGLLSEDIDTQTGEMWGNFPQTYSMVGLILCAMRLSKSWEEGLWRGS